jgi:hypothetical protein
VTAEREAIELEGNNIEDDYEFPGYGTELGWSNGKPSWKETMTHFNAIQEHKTTSSSSLTGV